VELTPVSREGTRFTDLLSRHRAYWGGGGDPGFLRSTGVFAPSVPVELPQADGRVITQAERLTPDMVDPSAMIDVVEQQETFGLDLARIAQRQSIASLGIGDLAPFSQPFFKVPWLEAILGCPIRMTEGQIWVERHPKGPEGVIERGAGLEHDPWFQLYLEFLRLLHARLGDRYPVSANTLLRGPSDLAAAIMGVREACVGWLDEPRLMARLMRVCTDAHLALVEAGYRVLGPDRGGYWSGWGIWAPGPVVRMQADHSTLLSPAMYKEQILPFDLEVIRSCLYCIFHIHNNGYHIMPFLVQVPELDVIEVVVDPYPTGERKIYELEMMAMILEHKPLIVDANFPSYRESEWMLDQLPRRGLCFNARYAPETMGALLPDAPGREMWILR